MQKLIVTIKSSPRHEGRQNAIMKTWGKDFLECGAEVFFTMPNPAFRMYKREGNVLYFPGIDQHKGLLNRMVWLMEYLQTCDFTHVVIMDDDCCVNVPLFMSLPWRTANVYGHHNGDYLAGCCTVWSKESISRFERLGSIDDVCVGLLTKYFQIEETFSENEVIRPWINNSEDYELRDGVAVQHYCRTEEQIIESYEKFFNKQV